MSRTFSLIRSVGMPDLRAAKWAGAACVDMPRQVRVHVTGGESAFVLIENGKLVRAGRAQDAYENRRPLQQIWPAISQLLTPGTSLIVFGGMDNQVDVIRKADALPEWTQGPRSGGECYAFAEHVLRSDARALVGTIVTEDMVSGFALCNQARIPFTIYDEVTACLNICGARGEGSQLGKRGGVEVLLVIMQHITYLALFESGEMLRLASVPLREGSFYQAASMRQLAAQALAELGNADSSKSSDSISHVHVVDLMNEPALQSDEEIAAIVRDVFPNSSASLSRVGKDAFPGVNGEAFFHPETADFRLMRTYPLPLFAFWPTT